MPIAFYLEDPLGGNGFATDCGDHEQASDVGLAQTDELFVHGDLPVNAVGRDRDVVKAL